MADLDSADAPSHHAGVCIDQAGNREAAGLEPVVATESTTQVPDPDDHHRAGGTATQHHVYLPQQTVDVVADAAGAVGAKIRDVPADFRRVHAGQFGQLTGQDGFHAVLGEIHQSPPVDGQSGHRGFGYGRPRSSVTGDQPVGCHRPDVRRLCTNSH